MGARGNFSIGSTVCGVPRLPDRGIFLAYIVRYPFAKKEQWARECAAVGLVVWFLLDTSLSIYYGVFFNVAFNSLLLVAAAMPLMFTRREFARGRSGHEGKS